MSLIKDGMWLECSVVYALSSTMCLLYAGNFSLESYEPFSSDNDGVFILYRQ